MNIRTVSANTGSRELVIELGAFDPLAIDQGVPCLIDRIHAFQFVCELIRIKLVDPVRDAQDVFAFLNFLTSWYMTRGLQKVIVELPVGEYHWLKDKPFSSFVEIRYDTACQGTFQGQITGNTPDRQGDSG